MQNKRIVLLLVALIMSFSTIISAKNIVVPTYYGYGVINNSSRCVSPYISAYYPYAIPTAYLSGYYTQATVAPVASAYTAVTPSWNGAYWYYQPSSPVAAVSCNLNIRSEPRLGHKSKDSNVIAMLHKGEQAYVMARSGNWYLVQSVVTPLRRGYVYGSYLRFYRNALNLANYVALPYTPVYCY